MDVGLFVPIGNGNATPEVMRTLGTEAEGRGFESVWFPMARCRAGRTWA